jgi:hypothetical protein
MIINNRPELWSVAKAYRHLEEASRDARYEGRKFAKDYLVDRLLPKFNMVRDRAVTLIKKHGVSDVFCADAGYLLRRT